MAHAYMFISIPTGTSTIFGEFHFIFSLQERFVKALDENSLLAPCSNSPSPRDAS